MFILSDVRLDSGGEISPELCVGEGAGQPVEYGGGGLFEYEVGLTNVVVDMLDGDERPVLIRSTLSRLMIDKTPL